METAFWLAYNGETEELFLVRAADVDAARELAAGDDSDGDEFSLVRLPGAGDAPVKITGLW